MRIDASSLLLAAQISPQRPPAANRLAGSQAFEPMVFSQRDDGQKGAQPPASGALARLGANLDIKI